MAGVLRWEQPKKRVSKKAWAEVGFEDGPTGGYMPNMSDEDNNAWKAKVTGAKLGYPQVEIRKQCGQSLMLIIVNLGDGYNYKNLRCDGTVPAHRRGQSAYWGHNFYSFMDHDDGRDTQGLGLHISMNGPATFLSEEVDDLSLAIEEARSYLNIIVKPPGLRRHLALWLEDDSDTKPILAALEEMGAKPSADYPQFNIVKFTAPDALIDPARQLPGVRAVYLAQDVEALANEAHEALGYSRNHTDRDYAKVFNHRLAELSEVTR